MLDLLKDKKQFIFYFRPLIFEGSYSRPGWAKYKMKKVMIGIAIVGVLLVSLASAGLVDFLSNEVSGSVSVKGPVFWLDNTDIMDDDSFSLKMNDNNVEGSWFTLESGNTFAREFYSGSLGVDGFYPVEFEITLDSKVKAGNDFCEKVCGQNKVAICLNEGAINCYNSSEETCVDYCEAKSSDEIIEGSDLYGEIDVNLYLVGEYGGSSEFICRLKNSENLEIRERWNYTFTCLDEDDVLENIGEDYRLRLSLSDDSDAGLETWTYFGYSRLEMGVRI